MRLWRPHKTQLASTKLVFFAVTRTAVASAEQIYVAGRLPRTRRRNGFYQVEESAG